MIKTRVFEVLDQRGQKQRWLLAELERRGYRVSEGYLSQIKAGTKQPGRRFIETLRIFSHLANVGDAKSLVIHPASTTHFRMSSEDLAKAGITEGTIRLSVGLENPDDLIEDLSRALYAAGKV